MTPLNAADLAGGSEYPRIQPVDLSQDSDFPSTTFQVPPAQRRKIQICAAPVATAAVVAVVAVATAVLAIRNLLFVSPKTNCFSAEAKLVLVEPVLAAQDRLGGANRETNRLAG